MNVQQLINELQKVKDKSQPVEIAINQYNQRYPIAYTNVTTAQEGPFNTVRIYTSLPGDNNSYMYTSTRKRN